MRSHSRRADASIRTKVQHACLWSWVAVSARGKLRMASGHLNVQWSHRVSLLEANLPGEPKSTLAQSVTGTESTACLRLGDCVTPQPPHSQPGSWSQDVALESPAPRADCGSHQALSLRVLVLMRASPSPPWPPWLWLASCCGVAGMRAPGLCGHASWARSRPGETPCSEAVPGWWRWQQHYPRRHILRRMLVAPDRTNGHPLRDGQSPMKSRLPPSSSWEPGQDQAQHIPLRARRALGGGSRQPGCGSPSHWAHACVSV